MNLLMTFNQAKSRSWNAELELWFDKAAEATRLSRRRHSGPLAVQRPFYPEDDGTCHVYLLHPPGGVAGGDELNIAVHLGEGAQCVLTTPGATKFYRTSSGRSIQRNVINIAPGAVCEFLPQESIIFDGADASLETRILLGDSSTYVGWDFICLGRPAARERFDSGGVQQRIEVIRNGKKIWFERYALKGGSPLQDASYGFAEQPVFGTMIYVAPLREGVAEAVDRVMGDTGRSVFSVSQLEQVVVCRYLGQHAEEGKMLFIRAWNELRTSLQSKPAVLPRIWAT